VRINQFTEVIECLQDEIIVFINKVIGIIHSASEQWGGAATKNYGDTYLLQWKLDEKQEDFIEKIHDKINETAEKRIKDLLDEKNGVKEEERKEEE
jgi:hypothetical protein